MSLPLSFAPPRLDPVDSQLLRDNDVVLNVLRLDLIHPCIHGNKWFKLKYNLLHAQERKISTLLSFGGAFSNHLYALAAAGNHLGLRTIGIVRGELVEPLNPILDFARRQGMQLVPVSREDYRRKTDDQFIAGLHQQFGEFHLIPEGGSNALAIAGCAEIAELLDWQTARAQRYVVLACGTGATLAGLLGGLHRRGLQPEPTVLGIGVINAPGYLQQEVRRWLPESCELPWSIVETYHGGGYAKTSSVLSDFLKEFATFSSIPLEPVYTGKLMLGLFDLIKQRKLAPGSEIIAIHTGGVY